MHHVLQLWPAELVELRDAASVDGDECGQLRRAVRRVVVQLEPASGGRVIGASEGASEG